MCAKDPTHCGVMNIEATLRFESYTVHCCILALRINVVIFANLLSPIFARNIHFEYDQALESSNGTIPFSIKDPDGNILLFTRH